MTGKVNCGPFFHWLFYPIERQRQNSNHVLLSFVLFCLYFLFCHCFVFVVFLFFCCCFFSSFAVCKLNIIYMCYKKNYGLTFYQAFIIRGKNWTPSRYQSSSGMLVQGNCSSWNWLVFRPFLIADDMGCPIKFAFY